MGPRQTNTDRIHEAEQDIDRIDKEVVALKTTLKIFMWLVPILMTALSVLSRFL